MKLQEVAQDRAYDYKYMYKRMWPYIKPYLFRGVLGILIAIPAGLMDGALAFFVKYFIDFLQNAKANEAARSIVYLVPYAVVLFAAIQGVLRYMSTYLTDWAGFKMSINLKNKLFEKLLRFESALYDKNSSGLVMNRFVGDADGALAGLLLNFKTLISNVTNALGLIFVLIYTSWQLSFFAILVLGGAFIPVTLIRKRVKHVSQEGMKIGSHLTTTIFETFGGNRIIAAYNLQKYQLGKLMCRLQESFDLQMGLTKRVNWLSPLMYLIASVGIAGVMWQSIHLFFSDKLTFGSISAFLLALILLYKPVKSLGNTLTGMQASFVAMNRVMDALDLEPSIKDSPNAKKIETIDDSICFENVWFEYDNDTPILKDINLNIKIGESLALVGNSGGGKSTIANLIPRFYDIKRGSIKIDGIDIREIEMDSLRKNIAVVFQDNFLFTGTIKENIILGNFNASEQQIQKAVKDAYLKDFIAELPEGLDTQIGERGVRLSGGQKQRVAIARAMLKDAPVVILDEATSALDNKSEAIVQKALDKLMENRTVIVIAHRLSTIKNATRIAVVNYGQIVEMGTHDELINIPDGAYKMLYDMQFSAESKSGSVV